MHSLFKKVCKYLFSLTPFLSGRVILLRLAGYKIGEKVYLPRDLKISDLVYRKNNINIGDRVSIGPGVILITDSGPNYSKLIDVFPIKSKVITIEEDVWIGAGAIIMPGVIIKKKSVIGAGSVVTKDIPPNSIAVGIPAKVIKYIRCDKLDKNT